MIRKIYSSKAQLSMELGILILAVIIGATVVGYYMLKSAVSVKNANIDAINKTSDSAMNALKTVN